MALLLNDVVLCGQISNVTRNTVRGWIQLRGLDRPLLLSLTGNCAEDLAGTSFRFDVLETAPTTSTNRAVLAQLAPRQIGPAGDITAVGRVQVANCTAEELLLGEQTGVEPRQWRSSLFLEWFGQNGRVVVELLDARMEFVDPADDLLLEPEFEDTDAESEVEEFVSEEEDDPYGLFPQDLEGRLEAEFGNALNDSGDGDDTDLEESDRADEEETPLQVLFDPPLKLYPAEKLTDRQVEESLQVLLARLARHNVALDMCEHFSVRDAYCLLLEHILPEEAVRLDWMRAGFVQHYSTHEFCPTCLGQFSLDEPDDDLL